MRCVPAFDGRAYVDVLMWLCVPVAFVADCTSWMGVAQSFVANIDSEEDPDGSLVDCTPSVRYSGRPGDPSWTSAFIELGYQLWKVSGETGRRRDCHSAAPPSTYSRRINSDGEGASAQ